MRRIRVIPVLLLHNRGLVKSIKFKNYKYVGDPINVVKIFNEKEVDEICILDISASKQKKQPDIEHIKEIVSEAFMPLSYGGGINSIEQAEKLFYNGVEKVVVNYSAIYQRNLITEISKRYGQQSVVVSIDYRNNWLGKTSVYTICGEENIRKHPAELARELENYGAGEILLNSIERDGTYLGYDLAMIEKVSQAVNVPVVACGGAGSLEDFKKAVKAGASAVSAGSMFIFQRPHNAVLVSYPSQEVLKKELFV
jgi:imidazole glycerol-phosphate synthase subunit HisF